MPRGRLMSCCYRRVHGIISMPDSQIAFGRDINAQRRFAEIIVQTKKKLHAEAYNSLILMQIGSPTWTRTRDLRINSPSLYQLSYQGIEAGLYWLTEN